MEKLDLTKPVRTRSGKPARILCTDVLDDDYPVIALVKTKGRNNKDFEYSIRTTLEGRYTTEFETDDDLINFVEPTLDVTKPVRTFDGHNARIIFTKAKGKYPIVALIEYSDGNKIWEESKRYTLDGYYITDNKHHSLNLINLKDEKDSI